MRNVFIYSYFLVCAVFFAGCWRYSSEQDRLGLWYYRIHDKQTMATWSRLYFTDNRHMNSACVINFNCQINSNLTTLK